MEKKMEHEMETGIIMGYIRVTLGYWDNGKENGNYSGLGLGSYRPRFLVWGNFGIMEIKMEARV